MNKGKILSDILEKCRSINFYDEKKLQLRGDNTLEFDDDIADGLQDKNMHWGQLKLLLSEIIHLANYKDEFDNIIYAGAAPGIHIVLLADLFPEKKFYLFDPNPIWDIRLKEKRNVFIKTRYFDDGEARKLFRLGKKYFLISDIRNLDIGKAKKRNDENAQDNIVENDMHIQFGFWRQVQPKFALFKFRLMHDKKSKFPTGTIYLPIYGKNVTTESRLFIKNYNENDTLLYDNKNYRDRMFYYHVNERNDAALAAMIICQVSKILNIPYEFLVENIRSSLRYNRKRSY